MGQSTSWRLYDQVDITLYIEGGAPWDFATSKTSIVPSPELPITMINTADLGETCQSTGTQPFRLEVQPQGIRERSHGIPMPAAVGQASFPRRTDGAKGTPPRKSAPQGKRRGKLPRLEGGQCREANFLRRSRLRGPALHRASNASPIQEQQAVLTRLLRSPVGIRVPAQQQSGLESRQMLYSCVGSLDQSS
jgi:hypothetical protein